MTEHGADAVLAVQDLTVRYGDTVAVNGATMSVRRGEIFGFIGPNGAGKSTTMRVLATLLEPDEGTATVLGRDVVEHAEWIRWRLGYMPDLFGLPEMLTVDEYLLYWAGIHALPEDGRAAAIETVLEVTDLGQHRRKLTGQLSKGVRQRLFIAATLLPEPEVLILDEPASGLDPRARIDLRELLRELQAMGKTILISSHVLAELSEICDSVGIIEAGRILAQGPVGEILARMRPYAEVQAVVLGGADAAGALVSDLDGVEGVRVDGESLRFRYRKGREGLAEVLAALVTAGHRVSHYDADWGSMEDLFLSVTRGVIS